MSVIRTVHMAANAIAETPGRTVCGLQEEGRARTLVFNDVTCKRCVSIMRPRLNPPRDGAR